MAATGDPTARFPDTATLRLAGRDLQVALTQADEMTAQLRHYLETDPRVAQLPMLTPDSPAWLRSGDRAAVDSGGQIRIGLWLLQARGDEPVLVYRPAGAPTAVGYRYVARLERREGRWLIPEISWEKIFFSR